MTREEWYKHRTLDHIQAVIEYVEIMLDGAMYSKLEKSEIESIYRSLIVLQGDISNQLKELTSNGKTINN